MRSRQDEGFVGADRMEEAFGCRGFPPALFYGLPHSLRFELGGAETDTVPRFLRALNRARAIARDALRGSEDLTAVAVHYSAPSGRTRRDHRSFQTLRELGFKAPFGKPAKTIEDDEACSGRVGTQSCRFWYEAPFEHDDASVDALIWSSVAREMGVHPSARWLGIYIVDYRAGLAIHIYDDRGMDIAATDPGLLVPLYRKFNSWLLDYDRPTMARAFGSSGSSVPST